MTNAEARFNKSLRPRKPEGSLGRTAQDVHLDSHRAPELWEWSRGPSALNRPTSPLAGRRLIPPDNSEKGAGLWMGPSLSHLLSFPYIILKSELKLADHILDLILTVTMKENQYQKRFSFRIINMFES